MIKVELSVNTVLKLMKKRKRKVTDFNVNTVMLVRLFLQEDMGRKC